MNHLAVPKPIWTRGKKRREEGNVSSIAFRNKIEYVYSTEYIWTGYWYRFHDDDTWRSKKKHNNNNTLHWIWPYNKIISVVHTQKTCFHELWSMYIAYATLRTLAIPNTTIWLVFVWLATSEIYMCDFQIFESITEFPRHQCKLFYARASYKNTNTYRHMRYSGGGICRICHKVLVFLSC